MRKEKGTKTMKYKYKYGDRTPFGVYHGVKIVLIDYWSRGKTPPRDIIIQSFGWFNAGNYFVEKTNIIRPIKFNEMNELNGRQNIHEVYSKTQLTFVKFFLSHFIEGYDFVYEDELEEAFL